jgi:hypothetical protein
MVFNHVKDDSNPSLMCALDESIDSIWTSIVRIDSQEMRGVVAL